MSGNIFGGAKKTTPQTRIADLQNKGVLDPEEKMAYHSARVPENLSRAVKRLAVDQNRTVQEITAEALELLLERYGVQRDK